MLVKVTGGMCCQLDSMVLLHSLLRGVLSLVVVYVVVPLSLVYVYSGRVGVVTCVDFVDAL
jgi:hypothetical protein